MLILKTIDQELATAVQSALKTLFAEQLPENFEAAVMRTADVRHGDYQCNDCMQLAKLLRHC